MQHQRRTNETRSTETRTALIAAARRLFVARTYAGTSTPDVAAEAGLTRGALYHHFADKKALFQAVVEAEFRSVAHEIERVASSGADPMIDLITGGDAFLRAMAAPGRTHLLLVDALGVLGPDVLKALDRANGGRTLREGIAAAMEAGALRPLPLDVTADLLGAAYDEAALAIESGADRDDCRLVLRALVEGLVTQPVP